MGHKWPTKQRQLTENVTPFQALAYHGGLLSIPVTVVMPVVAPIMKIENCKRYGATVVIHGQNIAEARDHALEIGRDRDLLYVNG